MIVQELCINMVSYEAVQAAGALGSLIVFLLPSYIQETKMLQPALLLQEPCLIVDPQSRLINTFKIKDP